MITKIILVSCFVVSVLCVAWYLTKKAKEPEFIDYSSMN